MDIDESLKSKHLDIVKQFSHVELRQFQKMEYKKTVLSELSTLLPECRKKQYNQTAQCVVNFLHSEVKSLLRIPPIEETQTANSDLLSETVIQDLDTSMLSEHEDSNAET